MTRTEWPWAAPRAPASALVRIAAEEVVGHARDSTDGTGGFHL